MLFTIKKKLKNLRDILLYRLLKSAKIFNVALITSWATVIKCIKVLNGSKRKVAKISSVTPQQRSAYNVVRWILEFKDMYYLSEFSSIKLNQIKNASQIWIYTRISSIALMNIYFFLSIFIIWLLDIKNQLVLLYGERVYQQSQNILTVFEFSDNSFFCVLLLINFILSFFMKWYVKNKWFSINKCGRFLYKIKSFIYYFKNYYLIMSLIAFVINNVFQVECTVFLFKSIYSSILILYIYFNICIGIYFFNLGWEKSFFYIRYYKINSLIYWNYIFLKDKLLNYRKYLFDNVNNSNYKILQLPLGLWILLGSTVGTKILDIAMIVLKPIYKRIEKYADSIGGWLNFFTEVAGQLYEYIWAYLDYFVLIPYDYFIEPILKTVIWAVKHPLLAFMYTLMFDTFMSDICNVFHGQEDYIGMFFMHYYDPLCYYSLEVYKFLQFEYRVFPYVFMLDYGIPKINAISKYMGYYANYFVPYFEEYADAVSYYENLKNSKERIDLGSLHFLEMMHYGSEPITEPVIRWDNILAWCNNYRSLEINTATRLVVWTSLEFVRFCAATLYVLGTFVESVDFVDHSDKKWTSAVFVPANTSKDQIEYVEKVFDAKAVAALEPTVKYNPSIALNKFNQNSIFWNSKSYLPHPMNSFNIINFNTSVFRKVASMSRYEFLNFIISDYNRKFWSVVDKEFAFICNICDKMYDNDQFNRLWNDYNYSVISSVLQKKIEKVLDTYEDKYFKIIGTQGLPLRFQPYYFQFPIMIPETEKEGIFIFTDYHKLIDEKLDMYSPIKAHEVFKTFIDSNLSDEELKKEIFLQYGKTSLFLAAYFNNLNSFLSYADPEEYIPIENLPVFGRIKSFAKQYSSTLSLIWQMLEADDEFDQWVLLQKSNQLSDPELYGILTSWTHRNDIFSYFNKLRMMYNINLVSGTVYRESLYGKPHNYIAELMNDRYTYNSDDVFNSEKNPQQIYNEQQTAQLIYTTSSEDSIKNKSIPRRKNLPISFLYYWDPKHPMTHQLTQPYTREKTLEVPIIYCDIAAGALALTVLYTIVSYFI